MDNLQIPQEEVIIPSGGSSGHDFKSNPLYGKPVITYNAGSMDKGPASDFLNGRYNPAFADRGFRFYDRSEKGKKRIENFDALVIAVGYASVSNGIAKGDYSYQSNIVLDTRTDVMQSVFMDFDGQDWRPKQFAIGHYKDHIKPALESITRKGGYTVVLVVYIPEMDSLAQIQLSQMAQFGILKAQAEKLNIPMSKSSFWGWNEMNTQFVGLRFTGEYEAVVLNKDNTGTIPATGENIKHSAKMFFQPNCQYFGFSQNTKNWEETYKICADLREEFHAYIASEQAHLKTKFEGGDNQGKAAPGQSSQNDPTKQVNDFADKVFAPSARPTPSHDVMPLPATPPPATDDLPF